MSKIDLKGALKVLAAAMSGREPEVERKEIDLLAVGKELVANEKLTAKQYELIQSMDPEQQGMVKTLLDAMLKKEEEPDADEAAKKAAEVAAAAAASGGGGGGGGGNGVATNVKGKDEDEALAKKLDSFLTTLSAKVDGLVTEVAAIKTNQGKVVSDTIKRNELIERLVTNEGSPFERADLEIMTTEVLTKLEAKMRPADYSGQGGLAANQRDGIEADGGALRINTGFLLVKPDKKEAA